MSPNIIQLIIAGLVLAALALGAAYARNLPRVTGWIQGLASTVCVVCVLAGLWVAWEYSMDSSLEVRGSAYVSILYAAVLVLATAVTAKKST